MALDQARALAAQIRRLPGDHIGRDADLIALDDEIERLSDLITSYKMHEFWETTTDVDMLRDMVRRQGLTTQVLTDRNAERQLLLRRVREALDRHPKACDEHDGSDGITCGWKGAVADVEGALGGASKWLNMRSRRRAPEPELEENPCGDYPAPCNCDNPETHDGH